MRPLQSYIICTTPRSGSTFLCGLLEATGRAGHPDSHFHEPSLNGWLRAYDLDRDRFASEDAAFRAVFDRAVTRGTSRKGLFGLRLQRDSFDFFMAVLARLYPGGSCDAERLTAAFGRFRIIYLEREDKLQQAISLTIAQQSGLWHRAADGSELERIAPPSAPFYDRGKILANLTDLTSQNAAWRAWFDQEDLAPHILKYEALAADPHGELAKTLSALDLDPTAARNLPLPTSKLADATNAAWAAKYRAELTS